MDVTDEELVREIRSGSAPAFGQLMRRHRRLVYRVAYGLTGDREGAMEVVQETFLKVHTRLGSWRGEGRVKNWIVRIAAHEALDRGRARRLHPTTELDEAALTCEEPPQERALARRESRAALHRGLAGLSPRQRLAIVLRYFEGLSAAEIGAALECSEGTARNMLCRGLHQLRAILVHSEGSVS